MQDQNDIQTPEILQALDQAYEDFAGGNYNSAEPVFKRALLELPGDGKTAACCLQNLSDICVKRGDFNEAIRLTLRLLNLTKSQTQESSDVVAGMNKLAKLYETAGRYEEASDLYYRAKLVSEQLVWADGKDDDDELARLFHDPNTPVDADSLKAAFESTLGIERGPGDPGSGTVGPEKVTTIAEDAAWDPLANEIPVPTTSQANLAALLRKQVADVKELQQSTSGRCKTVNDDDNPLAHMRPQIKETEGKSSSQGDRGAKKQETPIPAAPRPSSGKPPLLAPLFNLMRINVGPEKGKGGSPSYTGPADTITQSAHRIRVLSTSKQGTVHVGGLWQHVSNFIRALSPRQLGWSITKMFKQPIDEKSKANKTLGSIVVALVFLIGFSGWALSQPHKLLPIEAYLSMPHTYYSVDGDEVLKILHQDRCELAVGSQMFEAPLFFYTGDWREAADLAVRSLAQRQFWMIEHADMLVDDDRTELFPSKSGTVTVTEQMRLVNKWANQWYEKHGSYPNTVGELSSQDSHETDYDNPFTNEREAEPPRLQHLVLSAVPSAHDANTALGAIYDLLRKGGKWKNETDLAPGVINCCYLQIPYSQGTLDAFLIQSASQDGGAFVVNDDGDRYFVASTDGKIADTATAKTLLGSQVPVRGRTVWLIHSTDTLRGLSILRRAGAVIFGLISAVLFTVLFSRVRRRYKWIAVISMSVTLFITGLYLMQNQLP